MISYHKILICLLTGLFLLLVVLPVFSGLRLHKSRDTGPQVPLPHDGAPRSSLNSDLSVKSTHHETFIDRLTLAFVESLTEKSLNYEKPIITTARYKKASIDKNVPYKDISSDASYEANGDDALHSVDGSVDTPSNKKNNFRTTNELSTCIQTLESAVEEEKERAIRNLWVVSADMGVPEEALASLEYFLMKKNELEHVDLAEFVLADLRNLRKRHRLYLTSLSEISDGHKQHEGLLEDLKYLSDGTVVDMDKKENEKWRLTSNIQKQINLLGETALDDPAEHNRKKAIQALSTFRSEASVDVLLSAAYDPSPTNRYMAIQALWQSAIDGYENEREEIWRCLQQASADTEDRIADLATMALNDIEKYETEESHAVHTNLYNERNDDEIDNMHTGDGRDI